MDDPQLEADAISEAETEEDAEVLALPRAVREAVGESVCIIGLPVTRAESVATLEVAEADGDAPKVNVAEDDDERAAVRLGVISAEAVKLLDGLGEWVVEGGGDLVDSAVTVEVCSTDVVGEEDAECVDEGMALAVAKEGDAVIV